MKKAIPKSSYTIEDIYTMLVVTENRIWPAVFAGEGDGCKADVDKFIQMFLKSNKPARQPINAIVSVLSMPAFVIFVRDTAAFGLFY